MTQMEITRAQIAEFVARQRLAVVASVSDGGSPQGAVVGVVSNSACEVFFDTLDETRKCRNLRRDARGAVTLGWDLVEGRTVQLEGLADEPTGGELSAWKEQYFARFPDGVARQSWPGITYFRIRHTWLRYSDFSTTPPQIVELRGA